jgi:hypothetical protein
MKVSMTKKRLTKALSLGVAFGLSAVLAGTVAAQPNVNNGAAQNPPNQNPGGNGGNRPDFRNMTPEQRQQFFQQQWAAMQERNIRRTLERAGFTNQQLEDTVVAFDAYQEEGTAPLRAMAEKLVTAVSTVGTPDADVARLLKEFQDAVAKEKERRKAGRAELDKRIGYAKQPRLELVLTTLGLVGDDSLSMANLGGGGRFGGFGGGGFAGGPGGGPGGGGPGGAPANGNRQN